MNEMDIDDHLSTPSTSTQKRILSSDDGPLKKKCKPDYTANSTYASSSSGLKTTLHGTLYQLKLLLLFAIQAVTNYPCFDLATEMDTAEKFDDVVIKYKQSVTDTTWIWKFLQVKHKLSPDKSTIKISDLVSTNEGDFSLQKYFLSFCKIKAHPTFKDSQLSEFILCTNTDFDFKTNAKDQKITTAWQNYFIADSDIEDDNFFYFNDDLEFNKYKFSADAQPELSELFTQTVLDIVLNSKDITQKPSIMNFLELIGQTISNNAIREKIDYANGLVDSNIKNNVIPLRKAFDTILKLKTKVLSIDAYKNLKEFRANLEPNKNIKKTDHSYKQIFEEAKQEVKKIINLLKEVPEEKKLQLSEYLNPNTQFYIDLHEEANEFLNRKDIVNSYLEKLIELSTIPEIDKSIKRTKMVEYISEKTKILLKEPNANVESIKILIQEDLGKVTSKLVALELLIDKNKLKENLDDFINKFRIITKFPDDDELNSFLSDKLGQEYQLLNSDLLNDSFQKEMLQWFKQYHKGRSMFLTEEDIKNYLKEIGQKIHNLLASGLSVAYPNKLRSYGINFNNSFYLDKLTQSLHIVTNSTRLMSIQILGTLDNLHLHGYTAHDEFIFLRMRTLLREQTQNLIFESYNSPKCHNLLIIECQAKTKMNKQMLQSIFRRIDSILKTNKQKRLILISENNKYDLVTNSLKDFPNNRKVEYNIDFNTLSKETQESLLKQNCNFQGREIELNKIIDIKTAQKLFNKENLNVIIEKFKIEIGDTKAFDFNNNIQEYYIPRNLHRQKINSKILKNIKGQVFFVTEINESQVLELGIKKNKIEYYSNDKKYFNGIILCTENDDQNDIFQKLSTADNNSIYWLYYKEDNLYWKNSNRQFSEISKYLEIDNKNYFHEDDWNETHNIQEKVVIIANDAGVGKSTFLTSLAKNIQKRSDCIWTIRIDLNDFASKKDKNKMKCLKDITFSEDDIEMAVEYFAEMALGCPEKNNQIQHKLLKFSLIIQDEEFLVPKIVILFDGFDEISPNHRDQTITLIKAIYKSNIFKIYITTRIHEKSLLENNFQTPALMLKPFNEEDQISFLRKYWQYSLKFYDIQDNKDLRTKMLEYLQEINSLFKDRKNSFIDLNVVSEIIQSINDELSTDNAVLRSNINGLNFSQFAHKLLVKWKTKIRDNETSFNLIPLHLRMLAEIIFCNKFEIENDFHLLDLYDKFVKIKYDIYYDEKSELGNNVASAEIRIQFTNNLKNDFYEVAKQVLFPDRYSNVKVNTPKHLLARTGLVVLKGTHLDFIHRSFAGYFLSDYCINHLDSTDIQTLLLQTVFFKSEYRVIRDFFNRQLEKLKKNKLDNIDIMEDAVKALYIKDTCDNFLHTLAKEGYNTIFIFLIDKIMKYPEILQRIMLAGRYKNVLYTLIEASLQYDENNVIGKSYLSTIKNILNKFKMYPKFVKNILKSKYKNYSLFQKIIITDKIKLFEIVLNAIKEKQQLLRHILIGDKTKILKNVLMGKFKPKNETLCFLDTIFKTAQHDLLTLENILLYLEKFLKQFIEHILIFDQTKILTHLSKWIRIIQDEHKNKLILPKDIEKLKQLEIKVDNVGLILDFLKQSFTETIYKDFISINSKNNILFKSIIKDSTKTTTILLNWFYKNVDKSTMKKMLLVKTPTHHFTCLHFVCAKGFLKTLLLVLNFLKNLENDSDLCNILNCLLESKCKNDETVLTKAIINRKDNTTKSLLNFLSSHVDVEYLNKFIDISKKRDENIIMLMGEHGTSKSMHFLLDFIFNKLGSNILNNMIMSSNKNGDTLLHLSLNRWFYRDNICNVLLNFIHKNLDLECLKTILLKPNNFRKIPILYDNAKNYTILHQKLKVILTNIVNLNNFSELKMKFNTNEIETLQYYLEKHSERSDKERINTILESLKLLQLIESKTKQNLTELKIETDIDKCDVFSILNVLKKSFTETIFKDITSINPEENILFKRIVNGNTHTTTLLLNWFYENVDKTSVKEMLLIKTPENDYTCLHWVCERGFDKTLLVILKFLKNVDNDPGLYNTLNCLLKSKCKNGETALFKALIKRKYNCTESLLSFLSCNVDTEFFINSIHISNMDDENIIMVMARYGTSESMHFLLDLIFNKLGNDILNNMIMSSNKDGDTALHLILNKQSCFDNMCKVFLNFIHNNLGLESLKTILLKPNNRGKSPIHSGTTWLDVILHGKLEIIITNIVNSTNFNELTKEYNTNEIETLQYYLKKYSRWYDLERINAILENIKSHIPAIDSSND